MKKNALCGLLAAAMLSACAIDPYTGESKVSKTAWGTALGTAAGAGIGALAGGEVGRGAALGTAVGAGGGLVKSLWDKGDEVEIPANSCIELLLTQPITVSASSYSYEN